MSDILMCTCGHRNSMHHHSLGCVAMGCPCKQFVEDKPDPDSEYARIKVELNSMTKAQRYGCEF